MNIQVLCLCALLCAVACRSLNEEPTYIPRSELKIRAKRDFIGSCGCPQGTAKVLKLCIPCEEYEQIMEDECPIDC